MNIKSKSEWQDDSDEIQSALIEFSELLKKKPFQNREGLRGVSAFALYWYVKKIQPKVVFEVGTWKGFSTWIIEQAAPKAKIFCLDPIFFLESYMDSSKVGEVYRSKHATYMGSDFSCINPAKLAGKDLPNSLVFFDDHQDKFPRLIQAKNAGIKNIIFDDNTPHKYTHITLEHELMKKDQKNILNSLIKDYETFPALWNIDWRYGKMRIKEKGLTDFPVSPLTDEVFNERNCIVFGKSIRITEIVIQYQAMYLIGKKTILF